MLFSIFFEPSTYSRILKIFFSMSLWRHVMDSTVETVSCSIGWEHSSNPKVIATKGNVIKALWGRQSSWACGWISYDVMVNMRDVGQHLSDMILFYKNKVRLIQSRLEKDLAVNRTYKEDGSISLIWRQKAVSEIHFSRTFHSLSYHIGWENIFNIFICRLLLEPHYLTLYTLH